VSSHNVDTVTARVADAADLVRDRLWGALLDRDEYAAAATVFAAADAGMSAEDLLLDVIAAVQHKVGAEWAANRITVAQEHAATAINERVIAALAHHPAGKPAAVHAGRVTVACVDGEWHALPARLLHEVLRLRGWQVDFLGAHVPTPHLIAHLHEHGPDAVALSRSGCLPPTPPSPPRRPPVFRCWPAAPASAGTAATPDGWARTPGPRTPAPRRSA
jgi:methanogenic corrinoid protein MtbC1